jgi:hypothetical protein
VMGEHGFIYTSVGRPDVPHDFADIRKSASFGDRIRNGERAAVATVAKVP